MAIRCLDSVIYGVDDLEVARRFWTDFGLNPLAGGKDGLAFETVEGARVIVRPADDPSLPRGLAAGNTVREIVWGADTDDDIESIAAELAKDGPVARDADGTLHGADPHGYAIAFRRTAVRPVKVAPTSYNVPGEPQRVDTRGKVYARATPQQMSHIVLLAPDLDRAVAFYTERLGFVTTDYYPGRGYFLRAPGSHEHHNLFLLKAGDGLGFHHLAFELRDIHEVFGGGLHMSDQGWQTHLGPGRHPISSCYFWYFKNPCGGAAEYDSDSDYVTGDWQPRAWESTPEAFAEWAYDGGAQRYSGIQTGKA